MTVVEITGHKQRKCRNLPDKFVGGMILKETGFGPSPFFLLLLCAARRKASGLASAKAESRTRRNDEIGFVSSIFKIFLSCGFMVGQVSGRPDTIVSGA